MAMNACRRAALRLAIAPPTSRSGARYLQQHIRPWNTPVDRKASQPLATYFSTFRQCLNRNGRDPRPAASEGEEKRAEPETAQQKVDDRPWMRDDEQFQPENASPEPPLTNTSKGRLLTTPTRLLKLILPMPFHPEQQYINAEKKEGLDNSEDVQPLALLVHPSQPLSYLERLIQAEIPPLLVKEKEKLPEVSFRAEADQHEDAERPRDDNVASYSGLGREGPDRSNKVNWVRWSSSTEVGDFIRDAARGKEFAIVIEGHPEDIRVAVPSFKDRTHYMRMRLRRMSQQITDMAKLKKECDLLAHKGAHRIAQGGFAALAGWWGVVYYVTFHTEMGWDLVEPVTYLAGLTTIMGGYLWFLYVSKDLSYKAAMNTTVSRRQNALYQERGFDLPRWEQLVHEANHIRQEIKVIATEYDVEWNEMKDLGDEQVKEALESERNGDDDDAKGKESRQNNDQKKGKISQKES